MVQKLPFETFNNFGIKKGKKIFFEFYSDESKVLQYSDNMKYSLAAFAKVVKRTKFTGLWDAELSSYSPIATPWIRLYDLEHCLGIHAFGPTRPCLIVEVIATQAKFLQSSCYCTVINCANTFSITNIFGCLRSLIAQFELVKHNFSN